jgi:hypothetical protein
VIKTLGYNVLFGGKIPPTAFIPVFGVKARQGFEPLEQMGDAGSAPPALHKTVPNCNLVFAFVQAEHEFGSFVIVSPSA